MDLFLTLGSVFFAIETLHRAYDFYQIITLRLLMREHDNCEDCWEEEQLSKYRKNNDK